MTSAVHDRMPVILDPDSYDLWLDPGMNDVTEISRLLKPYNAESMRCHPVSTRINHTMMRTVHAPWRSRRLNPVFSDKAFFTPLPYRIPSAATE